MVTRDFSQYFLYRWRYVIGYSLIGLLLVALLVFAGVYLPGGLSSAEMQSVARGASLSFSDPKTLAVTSLPYYGLQQAIFALFGISIFTIKLPSLILGFASAVGLIGLLRRWYKPNIAVFASFIAISTGQFIYIAQSGTPSVLYIFWPTMLLLLGTFITRAKRFRFLWKILFALCAGLSLYTPLGIYPLLAIALAVSLHPHLRAIVRRLSRLRLGITAAVFIVAAAPLVWLLSLNPHLGITLLGIPAQWPPDILANIAALAKQYLMFWHTGDSTVMAPVFGLGSTLIIILGLYRLALMRNTTRSYLIIFWLLCIFPILIINPSFTTVTFVPSVLLLAAGLTSLISYWYRIFPANPYARVAGLIPIVILVGGLIITGVTRYSYGYHYNPTIVRLFSDDLAFLPANTRQIVVEKNEQPFYEAVAKHRASMEVVTSPSDNHIVVTREAYHANTFKGYKVTRIITNERSTNADRYYILQRTNERDILE